MANTKKKSTKKKSTMTKKKTTSAKKSTTAKKVNNNKKNSTNKKITSNKKTSSTKKTTPKKVNTSVKIKTGEIKKIDKEDLPALKGSTKEVSKNNNEANRVIKSEDYVVINKNKKRNVKKSNATKVKQNKTNPYIKKINKLRRKIRIYGLTSVIPKKYLIGTLFLLAFIIIIPISLLLFNTNTTTMDISSIPEKIDSLKTVSFNIEDVDDILISSKSYPLNKKGSVDLKDYYEYDFEKVFELDSSYVNDYVIKYNEAKKYFFIAIKATNSNHDNLKNVIDNFIKKIGVNNYEYFEYQDYLIYINSKSSEGNKIVKSKIMQSQTRVFDLLQDLKKDDIESTLGISSNLYSEAIVKTPMVVKSDVSSYAIFKPTNVYNKSKIISLMNKYYDSLLEKWNNDEENKTLLENRTYEEYKGYLIFLVSYDNKLVMDFIKSN